jgi:hypothetical protein
MTPVTVDGYLSKKEIEASYGRSFRSLTRDITRAVKMADAKTLRHLKIVTEDIKVREGTEVTLEMIQDLSNRGLRPMWLAEKSWVAEWCIQRSKRRRNYNQPPDHPPEPSHLSPSAASNFPPPPPSPLQLPAIESLQHRIDDQKQQIEMLRGQLQIKDEQIRTANQLAQESQQLMRDLHVLLKNVQDGLLGEGTRRLLARTAAVKATEITSPTIVEPVEPSASIKPKRVAKPAARKKTAKEKTPAPAKPSSSASVSDRLQRWFPTLLKKR